MLTITESAARLLAAERDESGAPETYGVRLSSPDDEEDGQSGVVIAFVPEPLPGDVITDQAGVRAFLAPELAGELEDATLDATPTNGLPPHLVLRR